MFLQKKNKQKRHDHIHAMKTRLLNRFVRFGAVFVAPVISYIVLDKVLRAFVQSSLC